MPKIEQNDIFVQLSPIKINSKCGNLEFNLNLSMLLNLQNSVAIIAVEDIEHRQRIPLQKHLLRS